MSSEQTQPEEFFKVVMNHEEQYRQQRHGDLFAPLLSLEQRLPALG